MKKYVLFGAKTLFFSFLLTLVSIAGWGQTVIFNHSGGGSAPTGWTFNNNVTTTAIDQNSYWLLDATASASDNIITTTYDLSSYTAATLTFSFRNYGSASNETKGKIEISYNGGTSYTQTDTTLNTTSTYANYSLNLSGVSNQVKIRISNGGGNNQSKGLRLQNLKLTASGSSNYTVTYNGNGNTGGSVPTDSASPYAPGSNVTVLGNTGNLIRTDYKFVGWTTDAANAGTVYNAGNTYTNISANTVFYAKWAPTYTVTYNGNGSTGGSVPTDTNNYDSGSTVTVLGNTGSLVRTGYTFNNWNTAANGSGTPRNPGATFSITANTTLYAQWQQNPAITLSDNGTQVSASNVIPGTDNVILSQFKIDVAYQNATLTSVDVLYEGTYDASDIKANGFKLWYSSSNSFSGATAISTKNATDNGGEIIDFNSLSQIISAGNTGYFWVTADIEATAVSGHTINLDAIANADLTFTTTEITKSGNASAGGVKTFTTTATIDWGNLQSPSATSVDEGLTSGNIDAHAYKAGITTADNNEGQIAVWIGVSPIGAAASSNPATWTVWIPVSFESRQNDPFGNLSHYRYRGQINTASLGLTPGTYRYAIRFELNGGPYKYGGYSASGGGEWDGTTYVSGILTVNSNLVDGGQVTLNPASPNEGTASTATLEMYEPGLTDVSFPNNNVTVEFAYVPAADSNPNSWTGWTAATGHTDAGTNDRYTLTLPASLTPGTYYVAARAKKTGSTEWQYFGANWSTWSSSAVLTVQSNRVSWANIQDPVNHTMTVGDNVTVYSQVNKPGITGNANSHNGITAWIGYSSTNNHPSSAGWTWIPATRNLAFSDTSNDEYSATFGAALAADVYYYAARYQITGSSEYYYAGHTGATNTGGEWGQITPPNTTENISGVLTIQTPQEINIKQNATNIASGNTYTFTPNQPSGTSSAAVTFTIENLGQADLILSGTPKIAISGANASEFTVNESSTTSTITGTGTAPNNTTTFTVTFSPTSIGAKAAQLSIANNDSNENPYIINLAGTASPANDFCDNAEVLTMNAAAVSGTMEYATISSPFSYASTNRTDVWYKFTITCNEKLGITLTGFTGDLDVRLYNSCASTTAITGATGYTGTSGTSPEEYRTANILTAGTYYIRVSAANAAALTSTFNIAVKDELTVAKPADRTVNAGTTANFSILIPAHATSYQWQFSADNGANWNNVTLGTGGTSNSYTTQSTTMAMNGYLYKVIVYNGTCQTIESDPALLTVNPATLSTDMFVSVKSGDWDEPATWMSSSDNGVTWLNPATAKPTDAATSIEIMDEHTVTVWTGEGARNLTVHSGATLNLTAALTNNGLFKVEDNANVIVNYSHSNLGLNLWAGEEDLAPTSTVTFRLKNSSATLFSISSGTPNITPRTYNGYTALFGFLKILPTSGWSAFLPTGGNYNITHNDLELTYSTNSNMSMFSGSSITMGIGRDFITDIGVNSSTSVAYQTGLQSSTLNIRRNYIKKGTGEFRFITAGAGAANEHTITFNIDGDFKVENGSAVLSQNNSSYTKYIVNLQGNLDITNGGVLNKNSTALSYQNSAFNFKGTNQTINYAGATKPTNVYFNVKNGSTVQLINQDLSLSTNSKFTVENGGTLDFGFDGTTALNLTIGSVDGQKFELQNGGTLKITSPLGIISGGTTPASERDKGNVQIGASAANRIFGTNATYHYIGKADQVSGNGLPAAASGKTVIVEMDNDDLKFWATPESGAGSVKRFNSDGKLEIRKGIVLDGQNPDNASENYGRFADAVDTGATNAQSGNLKMTGGRYILYTSNSYAMPHFSGDYDFTGGVIQFDGNDQSIRAPKSYLNVEVTGKNVGTPAGNITLLDNGNFIVKNGGEFLINSNSIVGSSGSETITIEDGGVFRTGDPDGFSGSAQTSIQPSVNNIILENGSTVEYSRAGDQLITVQTNVGQGAEGNYYNLKISGSGTKSPANNITVNNITNVENGATLTIPETADNATPYVLTAKKGVQVAEEIPTPPTPAGQLILENNANLMQDDDAVNSGNIKVNRIMKPRWFGTSYPAKEYNFFSSPVEGQDMKKLYNNDPANTLFVLVLDEPANIFKNAKASDYLVKGKGFAVKEPKASYVNGQPDKTKITAQFTGKPNNGSSIASPYTWVSITNQNEGWNLIGNPYPSNLDLIELYKANNNFDDPDDPGNTISPTFKFWDNTVNATYTYDGVNYNQYSYAFFNAKTGLNGDGVEAPGLDDTNPTIPTTNAGSKEPARYVGVAQGFIVEAINSGGNISFNNTMRKAEITGDHFFGKAAADDDKFKLQLVTPQGVVLTQSIVYFDGGNNHFGIEDSKHPDLEVSELFYSFADEEKVLINGRESFNSSDVVPLGVKTYQQGNYKIRIKKLKGIFENGQAVYLKDKSTGMLANLTEGDYEFSQEAGEYTNRFEIVYKPEATLDVTGTNKDTVQVYRDGDDFVVKSSAKSIKEIELYDMSGKLFYKTNANSKEVRIPSYRLVNGIYILKAQLENSEVVNKKIRK